PRAWRGPQIACASSSIISRRASRPEARQNDSKLAEMFDSASSFSALVGIAVDVVNLFMALLSFVESAPRSLSAQVGQRRFSHFNILRDTAFDRANVKWLAEQVSGRMVATAFVTPLVPQHWCVLFSDAFGLYLGSWGTFTSALSQGMHNHRTSNRCSWSG